MPSPFRAPRAYRIAISSFFFIQGLTFASWASRIPDIKNAFDLSDAAWGGILLCLPIGQFFALALSGFLVTRYGSRIVLITTSLLYPATLLVIGLASSPVWLIVALLLTGFFGNIYNIAVNTQAVGIEALYGRSIMASFHGLWSLAGFAGGLIGTFMIAKNLSPFQHYWIINGLTLLLTFLFVRSTLPRDTRTSDAKPKLFVKPDNAILILGILAFSCMICEGTMFDWAGVYFEKIVAAKKEYVQFGFVAFMSTMASGRLIADFLIMKLGTKRMIRLSGFMIFIGILTVVVFPYFVPSIIGLLITGLGVSSVVPLSYGLAGQSKTMPAGQALAAVSSLGFLGFLIAPPLIGFVSEGYTLRTAFALIALMGLAVAFLSGKVQRN
ncbi:MAG TPA: MFS transporter [Cyclobacteriaceae bacterium]|nr:MFS transporter [Cyclobacteriaceae bacterium]HMV07499.1 MFS transporter [Cyclobacteriaceae bacterium]HMW99146.1 MFS transporter [Cyclobacteriaceae bacterium]HMX48221.1 MFS transporter [Cyclobacteriaceae bacterium]HMY95026.1 MFS transporter [Cyclobacteriaceae bacterium]